ncbi:MAG: acyl-CoA dehydrogenase family protein [Candidatus Nanopelagicales bacterium]
MHGEVERELPTPESAELLAVVRQLAREELAPLAVRYEAEGRFPREVFTKLGEVGLLGLPYPEEYGGAEQPFTVYLQVIEELASAWLSVALGVSVHTLSAHALANFGTDDQKSALLPDMIGGELLGAYCLSEPGSGSDAAALVTRAESIDGGYRLNGTKAWITHGGVADFYTVMARTGEHRTKGISCFLVEGDSDGLSAAAPEDKMGMRGSRTAQVILDDVAIPADRLIGAEGEGFTIAMAALDAGRLGIAACAVGVAQAALTEAVAYANTRKQFGQAIAEFQGISFMIADMATGVEAARSLYLSAARRKDAGLDYSTQAAMAKLFATDMCMQVTTNAVQILGGAGYVQDFPAERYFRESKVLQIVEGTNQVQRLVIGRNVLADV